MVSHPFLDGNIAKFIKNKFMSEKLHKVMVVNGKKITSREESPKVAWVMQGYVSIIFSGLLDLEAIM